MGLPGSIYTKKSHKKYNKTRFNCMQNMQISFFKFGFTPCNAKRPLQGIKLQEKETKRLKHTGNLFKKNLQLKDAY